MIFAHTFICAQSYLPNWVIYDYSNAPFPSNTILNVTQDRDFSYWISFSEDYIDGKYIGGGLARFDGFNWQIYTKENSPLPSNLVGTVAVDSLGNKWIVTNNGIAKFDGIKWTIYNKSNAPLHGNSFFNVSVERDTILWFASYDTGIYKFDGINWIIYNRDNSPVHSNKTNFVVLEDSIKWIGVDYGHLYSFDSYHWKVHDTGLFGPPYLNISTVAFAIDRVDYRWVAGIRYIPEQKKAIGVLAKFIDTVWYFYDSTHIGFNFFISYNGIAVDKDNIKWFANRLGLLRFNDTTWTVFSSNNSPIRSAGHIIVDNNNNKVFPARLNQQILSGEYAVALVFYNENGVVLTSVKDEPIDPLQFYLSQNYPNPFNSSTVISYQLAVDGYVSLKVYDLLGREITTLVDEDKTSGKYEVTFHAASLPSGTYFYRLVVSGANPSRAGSYVKTKKMVMIK
jgi:hypothetical protein